MNSNFGPVDALLTVYIFIQAAAALKARSIALTEEKEIQRLISQVVKRQLTKLQTKLSNFEKACLCLCVCLFSYCRVWHVACLKT